MLNGKVTIVLLIVGLIKKNCSLKMIYFPPYNYCKNKIEVELDLYSCVMKSNLKNATGVDTSHFAKKDDSANLKSADKLDIDKLSEVHADKLNLFL